MSVAITGGKATGAGRGACGRSGWRGCADRFGSGGCVSPDGRAAGRGRAAVGAPIRPWVRGRMRSGEAVDLGARMLVPAQKPRRRHATAGYRSAARTLRPERHAGGGGGGGGGACDRSGGRGRELTGLLSAAPLPRVPRVPLVPRVRRPPRGPAPARRHGRRTAPASRRTASAAGRTPVRPHGPRTARRPGPHGPRTARPPNRTPLEPPARRTPAAPAALPLPVQSRTSPSRARSPVARSSVATAAAPAVTVS